MKSLTRALLVTSALAFASHAAAQETLVFGTTNPEQHPINTGFLTPWTERINADANGAVTIDLRHGPAIANHTNFYDRAVDDVVQITWGLSVTNPGKFGPVLVASLPFLVESSEQGTIAVCSMYEKGAFDSALDDIVPLLWVEFPQASLHMNGRPATSLDDMAGQKVITTTPAAAGIVSAFGGAPLSFGVQEKYEALQRGTAEGSIINFTAFAGFRLNEVTTDHYIIPLGGAAANEEECCQSSNGCDDTCALERRLEALEHFCRAGAAMTEAGGGDHHHDGKTNGRANLVGGVDEARGQTGFLRLGACHARHGGRDIGQGHAQRRQ